MSVLVQESHALKQPDHGRDERAKFKTRCSIRHQTEP
jgi:hypothetical protein